MSFQGEGAFHSFDGNNASPNKGHQHHQLPGYKGNTEIPQLLQRANLFVPGVTEDTPNALKEATPTGTPSKKRSVRPPPLPFRLPTEEEERQAAEKGQEGTSSNRNDDQNSLSPPVANAKPPPPKRRNLDTKPTNVNTIKRLFALHVQHYEENFQPPDKILQKTLKSEHSKEITSADMDKCVRWIRNIAPDLFWTPLHKIESKQHDEWKCFETVHFAATTTALKFMTIVEKLMKPGDFVKCGVNRRMDSTRFLCKTLTGILLGSEKQKDIPCKAVDDIFDKFYSCGFRALMNLNLPEAEGMEIDGENEKVESCEGCFDNPCVCSKIANLFEEANLAIQGLGLMDELTGPRLYMVMKQNINSRVSEIGTDQVDSSHINQLLQWLVNRVTPWVDTIYPQLKENDSSPDKQKMRDDFKMMILDIYGKSIIKDLFTVIIEFPESQPMLDDLRFCMKEVNLRNDLVVSLKSSLERRLLNAGVNTSEVLEAYIATVRALKYIDPSGILVQLVTPPVREYLKHREETVRVILVSLTEESGELSEELARNPTNIDKRNRVNMANWRRWEPDPIDVPKDKHNLRKSDLIEALVSIYGSKTVFIDEYRALLADRLLRLPKPGSLTREIKCLELLKLRFGESDLQKCEVMLKDVSDSQRLNTRFYEEEGAVLANEAVHVTGLIVSAQFWPNFKQEELELPTPVAEALEKYTKAFEMIKGNRTLEWQKHIGTVELEIDHGGSTLQFNVTPIQATIIMHFQDKEKWTLDELAKATGTTPTFLNARMGFWVSKGIIANSGPGVYALADSISEPSRATGVITNKYVEEADTDSPMASTSSQRATELQMFWSYIEAMLTNLESLPLARIHSMLKLFATIECSSEELQGFLDDKVSQNLLVYSAGQYQLPK